MCNIYVFLIGGSEEDTLPAVWRVRRGRQRGGVGRQTKTSFIQSLTGNTWSQKGLVWEDQDFLNCFSSLKLSGAETIRKEWWTSRVNKDIMLDCTGEVQSSGPQGSLGYCFSGLLIQTKIYLQLEEEFSLKCNAQTSRTGKSLHLPLLFLRHLTTLLGYLSFWKGSWIVCRNLWISDFYWHASGLFICLKLSLVRRSKPNPLECKHIGSLLFVLWNRLERACLWGYANSCL